MTFCIRQKDPIVTILLFELDAAVQKCYGTRHAAVTADPSAIQNTLTRLSADFVDVEKRAAKIAATEVGKAGLWAAVAPTIASGVIAFATALAVAHFSSQASVDDVKRDIGILKSKPDVNQLKTDIMVLQSKADPNELRSQIRFLQEQIADVQRRLPITNQPTGNVPGQSP